jgi:hypothetical protein
MNVKRTVRIVLVLLFLTVAGNMALLAQSNHGDWPDIAPELWNENRGPVIVDLALKSSAEGGPIAPPPIHPPIKGVMPLGMNPSQAATAGLVNTTASSTPGNLDASSAQAIPGSRTRSFLSEHRVAERSLRGTIKRLG